MTTASRLAAVGAELGEGPVWHAERREVIWVDILAGEVHACDLGGVDRIEQQHGEPVGAVALTSGGEILAATPRGLCRGDGTVVSGIPVEADNLRMNDGKPDPVGRFVSGTMTIGEAIPDAGSLWSLSGTTEATRLLDAVTIPNGLAWNDDAGLLYWIDTPTRRIDVFDYDPMTGQITDRRPWAHIGDTAGDPDGMCIDRDGALWVAMWGGGAVRCFVDGACEAVVSVPTPLVTCPTFAGDQLDRLVITTASIESGRSEPGAGDIYVVEVEAVGYPPHRLGSWAG